MLRSLARTLAPAALAIALVSCGGDSDDAPLSPLSPQTATAGAQTEATNTPVSQQTPASDENPATTPADGTYTVQSGDNLATIAQRFGVTVAAIVEANGIANPDVINVGQVLVIPDAE